MNSFRFAPHTNEYTQAVAKYWDERNFQMPLNISKQIKDTFSGGTWGSEYKHF